MKLIFIIRGIRWVGELTNTLIKFWIKNPQETPAIFGFITEKLIACPKFFSRNVLVEKHSLAFENVLDKTVNLYNKYGKGFDPTDVSSYKKLDQILDSKSQLLYFLIRKLKPEIIIETGVAAGESTGYILQALLDNRIGKLYSIDLPFQWYIYGDHKLHMDSLPAGKMPGYLVPEKLRKNWKLILGNTYDKLPQLLKDLEKIDIFLHDSEHSDKTMMFEYETSWPYIEKGGFLLSDDVSYTKAFEKFSKLKKVKSVIFKDLGVIQKNG